MNIMQIFSFSKGINQVLVSWKKLYDSFLTWLIVNSESHLLQNLNLSTIEKRMKLHLDILFPVFCLFVAYDGSRISLLQKDRHSQIFFK